MQARTEQLKDLQEKLKSEHQQQEINIKSNKQRILREDRDRIKFLKEKAKERETSLRDIKAALAEEAEQKREIAKLRKKDTEEF
jgi:hypothetical protein